MWVIGEWRRAVLGGEDLEVRKCVVRAIWGLVKSDGERVCVCKVGNVWSRVSGILCGGLWVCVSLFLSCNPNLWCLSSSIFQWVMNEGDSWLRYSTYIIY